MINKINSYLHTPNWLFALLLIVLVFRIPTLFEPYYYSGEMFQLALGEGIKQGMPLYEKLYSNTPPLLTLTAILAGNLFWLKAFLAVWHLLTVYLFWKFTDVLYPKSVNLQTVATLIFTVFTTLPILGGNRYGAEIVTVGLVLISFLIFFAKKTNTKNLLLSGFLLSLASLFSTKAVFDLAAIVFLLVIVKTNKQTVNELLKKVAYLLAGFLIPILIFMLWYLLNGVLGYYINAVYLQTLSNLTIWKGLDTQQPFKVVNSQILVNSLVLTVLLLILYVKRKSFSKNFIFLTAWLGLTLFAVTFTGKVSPHFLIQSIPAGAILLSLLFTQKTMEAMLTIIPLTILVFVPYYYNFPFYPTSSYYQQFTRFISNNISKEEYFNYFDRNTTQNYEIAQHIIKSTKPDDKILVWGDNAATIYTLSGRLPSIGYLTNNHIERYLGYENVAEILTIQPPELIVITSDARPFVNMDTFLTQNYAAIKTTNTAVVWKLLNPSVRSILSQ